jgi:mannan endo-1,4-beta-mannosidase
MLAGSSPREEFRAVYEAENARLSGNNTVSSDNGASGGKAVGNFADSGDNITFEIEVPAAGSYRLTLTAKGLGGNKYNELLLDGQNVGGFDSTGDSYSDSALRRVMLSAGKHTVSVSRSWGWIMVDKLTVTEDEIISAEVYKVEKKLINPNADSNAQELFSYLCDCYGKYTLAGRVCNDGLNGDEFKAIYEATGKYPAIVGLDMMDYCPSRQAKGARSNAVDTAIDFHSHGGIATFCWHWNAPDKYMKSGDTEQGTPRWWGGFNTSNTNFDIAAVMDGRDPEGKALIDADIAEIAKQLNRLRDAGVPVLWRPLHEASGGWFWWGAKGPDAYKKLWYYLYDQLTNKYQCSNLIWVWNGQDPDWYPGDDYVDVIGEDIYAGEHSYGAQNAKFSELLEYPDSNKLIALTENGTVFDIDSVVAANSRWSWFGTWCGDFVVRNGHYSEAFTEKSVMSKTYNSEYVITLDELPWYN